MQNNSTAKDTGSEARHAPPTQDNQRQKREADDDASRHRHRHFQSILRRITYLGHSSGHALAITQILRDIFCPDRTKLAGPACPGIQFLAVDCRCAELREYESAVVHKTFNSAGLND